MLYAGPVFIPDTFATFQPKCIILKRLTEDTRQHMNTEKCYPGQLRLVIWAHLCSVFMGQEFKMVIFILFSKLLHFFLCSLLKGPMGQVVGTVDVGG